MRQSFRGHVSRLGLGASIALLLAAVGSATAAPVPKVTICHVPPGNPAAVQRITVGAPAVAAHVAQHGDAVCAAGDSDCCADADGAVLIGGIILICLFRGEHYALPETRA